MFCFPSVLSVRASSQGCCTVGASSLGGVESGILPYKTLSVQANYQYNSVTRAFQGTKHIDDPLQRTATVGYFTLQMEYGLLQRLSVLAGITYSGKERELTITSGTGSGRFVETVSFSASGMGDLLLLAKYQLIVPTIASPFELALGGGANLPTGSYTREQNGAQLAIDLQPGTGASALIGWAFALWSFPEFGARFYAVATYRYAGTNLDGYRIGDEVVVSFGGEYNLTDRLGGSLLVRSRFAQQDFSNRRTLIATGGTYHDLMPGLTYSDGPSSARVFTQLPIYRNVRGIQLTLSYLLGVEYRYVFDFRSGLELFPANGE